MKALDRKLLRDLRRMWSQALTIALVVAMRRRRLRHEPVGACDSLALARDRFYADARFADVFAARQARAERARRRACATCPVSADVQTTRRADVRVEIPGVPRPDHRPAHRPRSGASRSAEPRRIVRSGRALDRRRRGRRQHRSAGLARPSPRRTGCSPGDALDGADQRPAAHACAWSAPPCRPSSSSPVRPGHAGHTRLRRLLDRPRRARPPPTTCDGRVQPRRHRAGAGRRRARR